MLSRSLTLAALALGASLLAPTLTAQTFNCTLLGRFDQYGTYNDIWGYVAPNGKEYALLGTTQGTVVIDCSNPANPIERGYFPWAPSTWRDIRTYDQYAYVCSEGGGGFQIIDLTNPDAPQNLGIFYSNLFNDAHNVCVDLGTGLLYLAGASNGTPVFDLSANPANPTYLGLMSASGRSNYFHDLCVENGFAYASMINNGDLRIYDVSSPLPYQILSNTQTPSNFTHNAWPNAAGDLVVTTDERSGGVIKLYDITNKQNPIALGQFTPNSSSTPHNAFIVGDLCHVSWYTEGYQVIDISDPLNPTAVAAYDTWPGSSGGFNGAWGVYPFQPSGNIYVSDISTGLYIVRPEITDLSVGHAALQNTRNEDGPYEVVATVTGSNGVNSVDLAYRVNGSAFTTVAMQPTGNPDEYSAVIPGQDAISRIEYRIDAADSIATRSNPRSGENSFVVGTLTQVWVDDFEVDRGWTSGQTATQNDWQRGTPNGASGTSGGVAWADPSSAVSGNNVYGNDLAPSGFNGRYQNNVGNWLQSPPIATNGVSGLRLGFNRWLSLAAGDTVRVLVNGILVWSTSSATQDSAWQAVEYDISSITDGQQFATIRFELSTNGSGVAGGWTLDDVELFASSDSAPPLFYGNGTAGTAGLTPSIDLGDSAQISTFARVDSTNVLAGANSFLIVNTAPDSLPIFGVDVLVATATEPFVLSTVATPTGTASWLLDVPNDPTLDNLYLYSQVLAVDPGGAVGFFSASSGMRFRVHQN